MISRLGQWVWAVLVGASQWGVNTVCCGFWWVLTGRGAVPNPDETFSGRVGRAAVKGKRWALIAERIVDGLLGRGHCRDSIGR